MVASMDKKPPAAPPPLPSHAEAPPAATSKAVILPEWWPGVRQQAEGELERALKDTPLVAESVGFGDGKLLLHVWDKVRGNARAEYHVAPFFGPGGEPGKLPSSFRAWLRRWVTGEPGSGVKPSMEFDGQPPPGPPPVIPGYVVIRHAHGWQARTYDLTPEALALIAAYETGRSGEMHRSDICDLISNDIARLSNDALKVPP